MYNNIYIVCMFQLWGEDECHSFIFLVLVGKSLREKIIDYHKLENLEDKKFCGLLADLY